MIGKIEKVPLTNVEREQKDTYLEKTFVQSF